MEKGIKETKELLAGVFTIVKVAGNILKDGAQLQDLIDGFVQLNGDPVKKKAIEDALAGIQEVPEEIKDADLGEYAELIVAVVQEVPVLIEAFKKPVAAE